MVDVSSSKWNFDQLPCRHEEYGSKCQGIFMMALAVFYDGIVIFSIINESAVELSVLIFMVFSIGLFLSGLNKFFMRTVTEFDGERFRYRHRLLFRSKAWEVPLSQYKGVLERCEYHRGSQGSSSYTLYIVELMHPDEQCRIKLWQSRSSSGHRAVWEAYSRQLALPAIREDEDEGYTRRDLEGADKFVRKKSVRELADEGKLEITFDPAAAVPDELELNIQGDQLEVVLCNPKIPFGSILIVFGIIALVIWLAIRYGGALIAFGYCFAILGVFLGLGLVLAITLPVFVGTSLVRIKRESLHILSRTPWGETPERRIHADAIKNVRVGKESEQAGFPAVVVETNTGNHIIGRGLDEDSLEWLKSCILSKIAIE